MLPTIDGKLKLSGKRITSSQYKFQISCFDSYHFLLFSLVCSVNRGYFGLLGIEKRSDAHQIFQHYDGLKIRWLHVDTGDFFGAEIIKELYYLRYNDTGFKIQQKHAGRWPLDTTYTEVQADQS
ncbi:uncharacterized protein LOC113317869 [Papaver somniferum]|uniref:uncharacterized protein LOC113317869 n=1 Tax=Papaver somniferum TaxID=3469 RepID=UPI000E6FA740|nr:uncharacterized protein LOC113317869 [Papaver somniferum]